MLHRLFSNLFFYSRIFLGDLLTLANIDLFHSFKNLQCSMAYIQQFINICSLELLKQFTVFLQAQ